MPPTISSPTTIDWTIPLAERVRPTKVAQVVGQDHILAPGKPLYQALVTASLRSCLLWGPPGVGKTTLAKIMATHTHHHFVGLSAVAAGVKEVRTVAQAAKARRQDPEHPLSTILFLDEIHRFNKAQQDILLPFVEDGTLTLVGATTENPSFELNPALLSRLQLYRLVPLDDVALQQLLIQTLHHPCSGASHLTFSQSAQTLLVHHAQGDGRRLLGTLELLLQHYPPTTSTHADTNPDTDSDASRGTNDATASAKTTIEPADVQAVLGEQVMAFDKGGEYFYTLISALHKSVRGCDVDAALYWLARLIAGGADLRYVARRLIRIASEDVGLADPHALRLAIAAQQAVDVLGHPEGTLALAQATVYLALAPKSNALYTAWKDALADAKTHAHSAVPVHLRNAPTALMQTLGYGAAYQYYFDDPAASFQQAYRPPEVNARYYHAQGEGWEEKVRQRLATLATLRTPASAPLQPSNVAAKQKNDD